jgi:hypothetical protein
MKFMTLKDIPGCLASMLLGTFVTLAVFGLSLVLAWGQGRRRAVSEVPGSSRLRTKSPDRSPRELSKGSSGLSLSGRPNPLLA